MTFCLFEHTAPGPACQPIISILPRCKGAPPVLCLGKKERGPEPVIFVRPDFYDDFACIASRCRHSCCVGWEIDIDSDALARWETIGGALGEKMRRSIAREPAPHFVLTKGERCPLLRADGLCELILIGGVNVYASAFGFSEAEANTMAVIIAMTVGLVILYHACKPFNLFRGFVLAGCAAAALFCIFFFDSLLSLTSLSLQAIMIFILFMLLTYPTMQAVRWTILKLNRLYHWILDHIHHLQQRFTKKNSQHA